MRIVKLLAKVLAVIFLVAVLVLCCGGFMSLHNKQDMLQHKIDFLYAERERIEERELHLKCEHCEKEFATRDWYNEAGYVYEVNIYSVCPFCEGKVYRIFDLENIFDLIMGRSYESLYQRGVRQGHLSPR